ncbi:MAG: tRNA (cytidine(34)-2'-O)-methyltransferase [Burkholderiaceae bacterium]|nr:tRNA (cytidine(34)-2'-O)-methyltransferase [Burkholderiaceae bacterium]
MISVVLVAPEIPPNTGNVIRLCANAGAQLHLVAPLGFALDHARLRRAGLDYREFAELRVHRDWPAFVAAMRGARMYAFSARATRRPVDVAFETNDVLVFGCETSGLPDTVLEQFTQQHRLRLPMRPDNRSLNLSNAVAIAVYEAWRQLGFEGAV